MGQADTWFWGHRLMSQARFTASIAMCVCSLILATRVCAANLVYVDPARHETRMIAVEPGVELETLDWGGSGPAMVLIPGLGGTAHAYDEIAPKLRGRFHVYGMTPRGTGKSSVPQDGYDTDHLSEDILGVLDGLKLRRVVLVGHSIAGLELSAFAIHHPERVAGLVYLDTTYLFDPGDKDLFGVGEWGQDLKTVRERFDALESQPDAPDQTIHQLIDSDWPALRQDLEVMLLGAKARPPFTPPDSNDFRSFAAFRDWFVRVQGFAVPEAELREQFLAGPNGEVVGQKAPQWVADKVVAGQKKYTGITTPALAIFAVQSRTRGDLPDDDNSRQAIAAFVKIATARAERRANAFKHDVPKAKIVFIKRASHQVFLSNEAEVLAAIISFASELHM